MPVLIGWWSVSLCPQDIVQSTWETLLKSNHHSLSSRESLTLLEHHPHSLRQQLPARRKLPELHLQLQDLCQLTPCKPVWSQACAFSLGHGDLWVMEEVPQGENGSSQDSQAPAASHRTALWNSNLAHQQLSKTVPPSQEGWSLASDVMSRSAPSPAPSWWHGTEGLTRIRLPNAAIPSYGGGLVGLPRWMMPSVQTTEGIIWTAQIFLV